MLAMAGHIFLWYARTVGGRRRGNLFASIAIILFLGGIQCLKMRGYLWLRWPEQYLFGDS